MIIEAPKKFLSSIARTLFADQFQRVQSVVRPQLIPQHLGQIGHRFPLRYPMDVKPFEHLRDAVRRLMPGSKLGLQFFGSLRFDVRQHRRRVNDFSPIRQSGGGASS